MKNNTTRKQQDDEWYEFALITDETGTFNEQCEVPLAEAMLKDGLLESFDGDEDHGYCVEKFYTVLEKNEDAVWERIVAGEKAIAKHEDRGRR